MNHSSYFTLLLPLVLLFVFLGCKDNAPSLADRANSNIKRLRTCYGMYLSAHDFRGPKTEEELKEYLKTTSDARKRLKRMGLTPDQVDGLFISERDNEPFRVRYGINGVGDNAVVFESVGVDGLRLVAFVNPVELGEKEYQDAWDNKKLAKSAVNVTKQ